MVAGWQSRALRVWRSIHTRVVIFVGSVLAITTIVLTFWHIENEMRWLTHDLVSRLDRLANLEAASVSNALWELNKDGVRVILEALIQDPDFVAAHVKDDQGRSFAHIENGDFGNVPVINTTRIISFEDNGKRREIGSLTLTLSRARVLQAHRDFFVNALILGFVQLAAVLIATALALREMIKPLTNITNRMLQVADGDYEQPVPYLDRKHEIGDVARAVEIFRRAALESTQAAQAIRESEERFRAFVDNSPNAVLLTDCEGRIQICSKRFGEWFGWPQDEAVGKNFDDIFPMTIAAAQHRQSHHALKTQDVVQQEYDIPLSHGQIHNIVTTKFPVFDLSGQPICVGNIFSDVTSQRLAEQKLRQSNKLEALGQLTGGMAHEFNNLLLVIAMNLELLKLKMAEQDGATERIERMQDAVHGGGELTERLLAYTGKQTLLPAVTDLEKLVTGSTVLLRPLLGERFFVSTETMRDLWSVRVDAHQLEQCLIELAINARDSMPRGGHIVIAAANVSVDENFRQGRRREFKPGDYVKVSVCDTGSGMAPDVLEKAFDPFFTTKEIGKGTGLGLSMVFGFVTRESGGFMDIDSKIGTGTTIAMYLPRTKQRKEGNMIPKKSVPETDKCKRTVLLAEDNAMVRDATEDMLRMFGFDVLSAGNGRDALALSKQVEDIDVLIADVVMPCGLSGIELASALRKQRSTMEVILMSGYPESELSAQGAYMDDVRTGKVHFLRKPFKVDTLLQVLDEMADARPVQ